MNDFLSDFEGRVGDGKTAKIEAFEESTVALVLTQLGKTRDEVRAYRAEIREGFGTDWFNAEAFIDDVLAVTRVFRFRFDDFFANPGKSEVLPVFAQAYAEAALGREQQLCFVFKAYQLGRLILTTRQPVRPPYMTLGHRSVPVPFYLVAFAKYFTAFDPEASDD
jgi:hypothetical protein